MKAGACQQHFYTRLGFHRKKSIAESKSNGAIGVFLNARGILVSSNVARIAL
jgi:hypothetical protein